MPRRENPLEYTTTGELYRGSLIRVLRQQKGLSRHQVATLVGYDPDSLSKVETNGVNASEQLLKKIATLLEVPLKQLQDAPEHPRIVRKTAVKSAAKSRAASTQGAPSQQTLSAAGVDGGVLQQILMLLQQLTGTVGQLTAAVVQQQAQVEALLQLLNATSPPDVPKPDPQGKGDRDKSSVNQNFGKASASSVRKKPAVELDDHIPLVEEEKMGAEVIMNWDMEERPTRNLKEGAMWDEIWTTIYEQPGDLRVVMSGLQGITLLPGHHEMRAEPILTRKPESEEAQFIAQAITRVERRRIAFERQVQEYEYWHITPIKAFDLYVATGIHRSEDWTHILGGKPAPPEQRAADIRHIIHLLKTHNNYHLGLFIGTDSEHVIYKVAFWELKAGHTLLLENLESGERNVKNTEPLLTAWFRELYERFWKSEGMITDKEQVIEELEKFVEKAEQLARDYAIP